VRILDFSFFIFVLWLRTSHFGISLDFQLIVLRGRCFCSLNIMILEKAREWFIIWVVLGEGAVFVILIK